MSSYWAPATGSDITGATGSRKASSTASSKAMEPAVAKSDESSPMRQEVFKKLSFMGMPHGDRAALRHLWKCVHLAEKVSSHLTAGKRTESDEVMAQKLEKVLAKDLGPPRAQKFMEWLDSPLVTPQTSEQVASATPLKAAPTPLRALRCSAAADLEGSEEPARKLSDAAVGTPTEALSTPAPKRRVAPRSYDRPPPSRILEVMSADSNPKPDESWVQMRSSDGRIYFWNRRDKACKWDLPAGVRAGWQSQRARDGRTYYWNVHGKAVWKLPALPGDAETEEVAPPIAEACSAVSAEEQDDVIPGPAHSVTDLGPFAATLMAMDQAAKAHVGAMAAKDEALERAGSAEDLSTKLREVSEGSARLQEEVTALRRQVAELTEIKTSTPAAEVGRRQRRRPHGRRDARASSEPERGDDRSAESGRSSSSSDGHADRSPTARSRGAGDEFWGAPGDQGPARVDEPERCSSGDEWQPAGTSPEAMPLDTELKDLADAQAAMERVRQEVARLEEEQAQREELERELAGLAAAQAHMRQVRQDVEAASATTRRPPAPRRRAAAEFDRSSAPEANDSKYASSPTRSAGTAVVFEPPKSGALKAVLTAAADMPPEATVFEFGQDSEALLEKFIVKAKFGAPPGKWSGGESAAAPKDSAEMSAPTKRRRLLGGA